MRGKPVLILFGLCVTLWLLAVVFCYLIIVFCGSCLTFHHLFWDEGAVCFAFYAPPFEEWLKGHKGILYYPCPSVRLRPRLFVCVEVLRPSQPNGVMSSAVSLPNHTFTGQA